MMDELTRLSTKQLKHRALSIGKMLAGVGPEDRKILWLAAQKAANYTTEVDCYLGEYIDDIKRKEQKNGHSERVSLSKVPESILRS